MPTCCQRPITLLSHSDVNLNVLGVKIKVNTTGVVFKFPGVIVRDKSVYYRKLISDNSHDSKKLWWELHKVLQRSHGSTLPTHESSKTLADRFASFFSNKIMFHPVFDPPKLTVFTQVTQDEICKIISKSKMIFIRHYLRVKLLPWYFLISLPLILLIIPLSLAVFWIGSVLMALFSNGFLLI